MELIPDALVVLQDGQYQIVNSAFNEMFGYTKHDVDQGLSFFELVQEKDKEAVKRRYEARLAEEQVPRTFRIDLITKDGSIIPCETSAAVIEFDSRTADLVLIRDVSERVRAEDALVKSEAEYHELFGNMLEGVYRTLPDGAIIKANPALVEMLGYDSEEELCTSARSGDLYASPDTRLDLTGTLEEEGELRAIEILLRRKDGELITVLENARVVRDSSGKVSYYEGLLTDITGRKRAEKKLQESEDQFRSITENAVDSIFIKDRTRRYTFVNRAMLGLLGLTEEELLGRTPEEVFGPEQGHAVEDVDDRTFSGETVDESRRLVIGDKEYFFHTLQTPLNVEDGQVTSIMGIVRDITIHRRAEDELREERERAQSYLDIAGVMFVAIDAVGTVLLVNRKACDVLGYAEEEIVGKNWFDTCLPHRQREKVKEVSKRLLLGEMEPAEYYENPVLTKSGSERLIAWHNTVLRNDEGAIISHLSSGEDITERKRAEEALRESEERFKGLVEQSPLSIQVMTIDGKTVQVNKAWEQLWGATLEDLRDYNMLEDKQLERLGLTPYIRQGFDGEAVSIPVVQYDAAETLDTGSKPWVGGHIYPVRGEDGAIRNVILMHENITERKLSVEKLRETTEVLETERQELTEKNIALKQILEHIERQKQSHRQQMCSDMEKAIIPAISRLKRKIGLEYVDEIEDLETAISVVLSKDIEEHVARYGKLTSREAEVCDMIKAGMSSKEIADSLNLSLPTVLKHREHARDKLGITGKSLSLSSYLRFH